MVFFIKIRGFINIIIALSISLFYCNMKSNAQDKWYHLVNIGQHFSQNHIVEKEVEMQDVENYLQYNADNIFNVHFKTKLSRIMNEWIKDDTITPARDFQNDPYFKLITDRKLEYTIAGFTDDKVNIYFYFTFGSSRWHHYNALLENLILPRNEMVDSILNMKYYDDLYKTEYKGIKHGSSIMIVEQILGDDYYEYLGQSMQLRNIYFKNYNTEFCIQDGIVKYISSGIPSWMDSDLVRKNK